MDINLYKGGVKMCKMGINLCKDVVQMCKRDINLCKQVVKICYTCIKFNHLLCYQFINRLILHVQKLHFIFIKSLACVRKRIPIAARAEYGTNFFSIGHLYPLLSDVSLFLDTLFGQVHSTPQLSILLLLYPSSLSDSLL